MFVSYFVLILYLAGLQQSALHLLRDARGAFATRCIRCSCPPTAGLLAQDFRTANIRSIF